METRNLSLGCLRFFRLALLPVLDPLFLTKHRATLNNGYLTKRRATFKNSYLTKQRATLKKSYLTKQRATLKKQLSNKTACDERVLKSNIFRVSL